MCARVSAAVALLLEEVEQQVALVSNDRVITLMLLKTLIQVKSLINKNICSNDHAISATWNHHYSRSKSEYSDFILINIAAKILINTKYVRTAQNNVLWCITTQKLGLCGNRSASFWWL